MQWESLKETQLAKATRLKALKVFFLDKNPDVFLFFLLASQPAALLFNSTEAHRGRLSWQITTPGRETAVKCLISSKSCFTQYSTIAARFCLRGVMAPSLSGSLKCFGKHYKTSNILKKLHRHKSSAKEWL